MAIQIMDVWARWTASQALEKANGKLNIITSNTTLDDSYDIILCNSSSALTLTLPLASTVRGHKYNVTNINTGVITVGISGSDLINGQSSITISGQYTGSVIVSDGANWYVIGASATGYGN